MEWHTFLFLFTVFDFFCILYAGLHHVLMHIWGASFLPFVGGLQWWSLFTKLSWRWAGGGIWTGSTCTYLCVFSVHTYLKGPIFFPYHTSIKERELPIWFLFHGEGYGGRYTIQMVRTASTADFCRKQSVMDISSPTLLVTGRCLGPWSRSCAGRSPITFFGVSVLSLSSGLWWITSSALGHWHLIACHCHYTWSQVAPLPNSYSLGLWKGAGYFTLFGVATTLLLIWALVAGCQAQCAHAQEVYCTLLSLTSNHIPCHPNPFFSIQQG